MTKLIKIKAIAISMCFILLSAIFPAAVFASPSIDPKAYEHIQAQLRSARIPNAAVAVISGFEVSYVLSGAELDTLFMVQSVAKPITAFGVLLLEDMGLLSIYDSVNRHLPWFEVRYNGVPVPHEDITIYNLIHHTSGIAQNEDRFPRAAPTETTDEFIARLVGMELDFYPSASTSYSNMAYIVLGLLIEAVSGQSYDEFMTEHVLHPLGLYNTFTNSERARATGRVTVGHRRGFFRAWQDTYGETRAIYGNPINMPSGGIYSSVSDMARWAGIQLGMIDVPEQFARAIVRSHVPNLDAPVAFASGYNFAGGWYMNLERGYIEHAGGGNGYSAIVRIHPESASAVVVLSSLRLNNNIEGLAAIALDAVLENDFNRRGLDLFEMIDIGFTVICVWGVVSLFMLVRLVMKVRRQLRSGAVIRSGFSQVGFKGLFGLLFTIAGLVFYYVFPYVLLDSTRTSLLQNWPVSFGVAAVGVWMNVVYDLFGWWVTAFVRTKSR